MGRVTVIDSAVQTHALRFLPKPGAAPSIVHSKDVVEVSDRLVVIETSTVETLTGADPLVLEDVLVLELEVEPCVGHPTSGALLVVVWNGDKLDRIV